MFLDIIITLSLVLLNSFFVAAEFAIVKVRYSQIQIKAQSGDRLAKTAQHIIDHLDTYLSATQLGITLASLGLGWIGEPIVATMIKSFLAAIGVQLTPEAIHAIALPTAFILITALHIIFGELAPKSIAIRKPEPTSLFVALPLQLFYYIFRPFIWAMNAISNSFLRLIGIQPAGDHDIHSSEELQLLVQQSREGGKIEEEDYEIIKNAFDFTDHNAKQIMVPRQHIFAIDVDLPTKTIVERILESGYSRVPVYQKSMDNILGIAYTKDVLKQYFQNPNFSIKDTLHPAFYVYENKKISDILREFQHKHVHIAVIIDEFGGTEGIITLEDILEELVGEIQDEADDEKQFVEKKEDGVYVVQAIHSLEDINDHLPHPFIINENYNTLSGLLLYHLADIPKLNQVIKVDGYQIKVTKINNRSVQCVELIEEKKETPPEP